MDLKDKKLLDKFLSSFEFDKRLAKYEIKNCIVWLDMLGKKNVVDKIKAKNVISKLKQLEKNIDTLLPGEDVHFAVEKSLENLLGDKSISGIIRTARSRNDLVVSDERLYLKDEIINVIKLLIEVIKSIVDVAEKNIDIPMCGYTHLQPAQPVLFSHYILSFCWMFLRDIERLQDCYKRVDVSVLGSGAFAGTTFDIDREYVAKKLGFSKVSENSVDSVSDRDFIVEFIFCCGIIMMHISRLAEELIIWLNPNFSYISLPEELTSGSSIMPQKQNPDYLELLRGKTGKVYADIVGILTMMKSLPLSYNRDMQEDKIFLFSTADVVKDSLKVLRLVIQNMKVEPENLKKSLEHDYIFATEIANFLVKEYKIDFVQAHKILQKVVSYCRKNKKKLQNLTLNEINKLAGLQLDEKKFLLFKERLNPENIINRTVSSGGTSIMEVKKQIKKLSEVIKIRR